MHESIDRRLAVARVDQELIASQVPAINGPETFPRNSAVGPQFAISPGKDRFWAVEVVTDSTLFAGSTGSGLSDSWHRYASWEDYDRLVTTAGDSVFTLPRHAWLFLREAQELFYRLLTSSSPNSWQDYKKTFQPAGGGTPQSVRLLGTFGRLDETPYRPEEDLWRVDPKEKKRER